MRFCSKCDNHILEGGNCNCVPIKYKIPIWDEEDFSVVHVKISSYINLAYDVMQQLNKYFDFETQESLCKQHDGFELQICLPDERLLKYKVYAEAEMVVNYVIQDLEEKNE